MIKRAVLLSPALLFFSFFVASLLMMGRLSLFRSEYPVDIFVGLENFRAIFTDRDFFREVANSFLYVGMTTPVMIGAGLFVALTIQHISPGIRGAAIFMFYIPSLSSGVISISIWRWVFSGNNGLLNQLFGIDYIWMLNRYTAIAAVSVSIVTAMLGYLIIIFMVALGTVQKGTIDSAKIDGARRGQITRYIMLPTIKPVIQIMVLVNAAGMFLIWENIRLMGPVRTAHNLMYSMYTTAFELGKYGEASAKALVLVGVIVIFAVVKRRVEK